jgi:hypothetical protein
MTMKRTMMAGLLVLGVTAVPAVAVAQNASVYAVHGIPGEVLGPQADPSLPVDVSVQGGGCISALNGFTFGEIRGPLSLPPGAYTLEIRPADSIAPCSKPVLLTSPAVAVAANRSYSVVAHLTAAGAPTISAFANDVSRTEPGKGRVLVHHTAAAPAVDVTLARGAGNGPSATLAGVENPQQGAVQVRPGDYLLSIAATGGSPVVSSGTVSFAPFTTTLVYAIGSLSYEGTFQLAAKVVPSR